MEPEGSLPHSQVPATCPYSWASMIQSILPHPTSWRSFLILSSHPRLGLPSGLFPSGFPTKTLCTPLLSLIRATCPSHLILLDFIHSTATLRIYRSYPPPLALGDGRHLQNLYIHQKYGGHEEAMNGPTSSDSGQCGRSVVPGRLSSYNWHVTLQLFMLLSSSYWHLMGALWTPKIRNFLEN